MVSRFQAAPLVASSVYPNAIAWSDENLVAITSADFVTIMNPTLPFGPRGLITIPVCEPYAIGVVKREDLLTGCLLSTALSRDRRPCVRSVSWSPIGMASNSGCMLAVCTTEGRVKLFRPPFCDFCAEWIEVIDISDKLYDYLASNNFAVSSVHVLNMSQEQTGLEPADDCANVLPKPVITYKRKRKCNDGANGSNKVSKTFEAPLTDMIEEQSPNVVEMKIDKRKKHELKTCPLPQITAEQYACRSAMLSSTVVAWSPMLCFSAKNDLAAQNSSPHRFSLLAVGGKSGQISLWKIAAPHCHSIENSGVPSVVTLVGFLQAHNSWVTTVNWAVLSSYSNPRVLLASGSSDGSVRIWLGDSKKLMGSFQFDSVPFVLLKEVISANVVPVSVLSLVAPVQAGEKILLAVGKGSGSFEVWDCHVASCKFNKVGFGDAHDYIVTGLAWAFDGRCLYSCSQDNYVRCWLFHGNSLYEVPLPSNTLGSRSSDDIADVFLSCQGVAVSPGNLVLSLVRNLDVDQLDQMYEARSQKAMVEFFWIGGQRLDIIPANSAKFVKEPLPDHCEEELLFWESNILWSLKMYENPDKPLVVWDIIATLLAFKQSMPENLDHILARWLSNRYLDSRENLSIDEIFARLSGSFSTIASRLLQLLNIICRCIILTELTSDEINRKVDGEQCGVAGKHQMMWIDVLLRSEKELRERLMALNLFALSSKKVSESSDWFAGGVAQIEQWVRVNHDDVKSQLKVLISRVQKQRKRLSSSETEEEEKCTFCSAPVLFDSPEIAVCQSSKSNNKDGERHKLVRCAVSMQVCPATPLWFCKCCNRRAMKLAPELLFTLPKFPSDLEPSKESCTSLELLKPLCPFCGVLLQRLQPDFLLSASPV